MSMSHDDALRLQQEIERSYPQLTCAPRQYAGMWSVEVTNPLTNEQINVVDATTWQDRLANMQGLSDATTAGTRTTNRTND